MKVKIKLFATLRNYGPEEQEVELPENATLEDAIKLLNLPEKIPLLKIVAGEHRPGNHPLKEGDEIALFPPIAGGQQEGSSGSFLLSCD
jgi:molybdopterin converting factor small subunit